MKFINIIFILTLVSNVYSQTLFEDAINQSNNDSVRIQNTKISQQSSSSIIRLLSTNIESVIIRGDIQALYEIPVKDGWSNIYYIHYNPQGYFSEETGDMGLLTGGRYYLDSRGYNNSLFLQGLGGFNLNSTWDLLISLEFGYRLLWKNNIFLDTSLAVNRSYRDQNKDPMVYLKINLTFGLKNQFLPFL